MFHRYVDVEIAMNRLVEKEFIQGSFLVHLSQGTYTIPQLQYFAIQYSYYSRHFPRVLGAAISAMEPLDTWWVPLADNLWDEAGRGKPGYSHEQLYKTFLSSLHPDVSLDARGLPVEPISNSVTKAVQTFIDFFRTATPLEAMAAVGLGSELFAGTVMGAIANGFRHPNYNERPINLRFWDVHADEHEPHHYQLCKDILVQYTEPSDLETMVRVGLGIAKSEAAMYQGLHEEMQQR